MNARQLNVLCKHSGYGRRCYRQSKKGPEGRLLSQSRGGRSQIISYAETIESIGIPVIPQKTVEREQMEYKQTVCYEKAERDANRDNPLLPKPRKVNLFFGIFITVLAVFLVSFLLLFSWITIDPDSKLTLYFLEASPLTSLLIYLYLYPKHLKSWEELYEKTLKRREHEKQINYDHLLIITCWISESLTEYENRGTLPVPEDLLHYAKKIKRLFPLAEIKVEWFYEDPFIFALFPNEEKVYFGHWK